MLAKVYSAAILGVEAYLVEVEVDISQGLPGFTLVGLPQGAVKESKERLRAAIKNAGFPFPTQKITVNLAPADLKKEGSAFDLPIAVALLAAAGVVPEEKVRSYLFYGELSLDGRLKSVPGVLPVALSALKEDLALVCPKENLTEAALARGLKVLAVEHLNELFQKLGEEREPEFELKEVSNQGPDLAEVIGQEQAKRALEIAAAGGHNLLFVGPPGAGKTMLAKRMPGLLPPLSLEEALETSRIYSVLGLLDQASPLLNQRPFRAPHHTISDAGLIGGGNPPKPGEISLAHNGVLFLDELPEFRRNTLEALREPLESGEITVARAQLSVTYPAKFVLLCAMNPCRCGYYGDRRRPCQCSPQEVRRYRQKLSGPLLDRIDLHVEVPAVDYQDLANRPKGESTAQVRQRVLAARERQKARFQDPSKTNAQMGPQELERFCSLRPAEKNLLEKAARKLNLSARAYHRVLKIARTIADLSGEEEIVKNHLLEALQYRLLDRLAW